MTHWTNVTPDTKSYGTVDADSKSYGTLGSSDRIFSRVQGFADGAGGIDFVYTVAAASGGGHSWLVTNDRPIMLRSRSNISSYLSELQP